MNIQRWFWLVCLGAPCSVARSAFDWELQRFEGRDYCRSTVWLRSIGLPAPPPIVPLAFRVRRLRVRRGGLAPSFSPAACRLCCSNATARTSRSATEVARGDDQRRQAMAGVSRFTSRGRGRSSRVSISPRSSSRGCARRRSRRFGPVRTVVIDPGHGGHDRGAISRMDLRRTLRSMCRCACGSCSKPIATKS